MSQSLAQVYLHIIFSTKERRPFLQDSALRKNTHAYLAGVCRNLDSPSILIGGVADHVHLLCYFGRSHSISETLRELKRDSSKWVKSQSSNLRSFGWQDGYGAFSVSPSHVAALKQYIARQEQHHRKESFQDEFRRLLRKYDVTIDERYVWD